VLLPTVLEDQYRGWVDLGRLTGRAWGRAASRSPVEPRVIALGIGSAVNGHRVARRSALRQRRYTTKARRAA